MKNLVDKDGNTIEIEVPDHINFNEEVKKAAKLSAEEITKHLQHIAECERKGYTTTYCDY